MSLLRPLMAGVLLLAVSSIALGPPNGTVGTLDFRYPNFIVEPLVSCPYEGYFLHPRNNTWFYRCYKRYNSSFFWRAYFQCPPCTVFSGALDQCVFQETGTHCPSPPGPCRWALDDCRTCRADNSNRATSVCFEATVQCPGQPDKPLCREGYVFDRSDGVCRSSKRSDPLQWSCVPDSYPTLILPPMTTPPPTTRSTTTPPAPPPTQPPPTPITPPVPTPPRPNFSPEQCDYHGEILGMAGDEVRNYCHPLCGDGGQTQDSNRYCDNFYQCLKVSDKSKFILHLPNCPHNYIFDRIKSTCKKITNSDGNCITLDSSITTSTSQCVYVGQLMGNLDKEEYPELPCNQLTRCSDGSSPRGTLTLCDEFYQCRNNDFSVVPTILKQHCDDPAKKFNPQTRRCVNPKTHGCRPNKNLIR